MEARPDVFASILTGHNWLALICNSVGIWQFCVKAFVDVEHQSWRKERNRVGAGNVSLQVLLEFDVRDGQTLFLGYRHICVEVLSNSSLNVGRVCVLTLDSVRVIRVHCS
jgi:hypothetical protein